MYIILHRYFKILKNMIIQCLIVVKTECAVCMFKESKVESTELYGSTMTVDTCGDGDTVKEIF